MPQYIIKRGLEGKRKKINIIISEHQEEDGVFVSKINPDIFISKNDQDFNTDLSTAIALFEKNLNSKEKEILY